jgi:hypothetical protein
VLFGIGLIIRNDFYRTELYNSMSWIIRNLELYNSTNYIIRRDRSGRTHFPRPTETVVISCGTRYVFSRLLIDGKHILESTTNHN